MSQTTTHSGRTADLRAKPAPEVTFGDARLPRRFWAKVQPQTSGCWAWTGAISPSGYGYFSFDSRGSRQAYRGAYIALVGAVPSGLHLDHRCSNRVCVNPAHLEPVTAGENNRRTGERRTHCKRGHALSPENTKVINLKGKKGRLCRTCWLVAHSRASRNYYNANKKAARK